MQISSAIESVQLKRSCVVTIGTFDGLHAGHMALIRTLRKKAEEKGVISVVLTFRPHPRVVLNPDEKTWLLSTYEERQQLLTETGVDVLIEHPFTEAFSKLSYATFVDEYLMRYLKPMAVVVGFNHLFGNERGGDFSSLDDLGRRHGFEAIEVGAALMHGTPVSSSRIRNALILGDIGEVTACLGRRYSFSGRVVPGSRLGRSIGFPTANIEISQGDKLLPAEGVYACFAFLNGERYKSMLNIGKRPTVLDGGGKTVEVHMMQFEGDAYEKEIRIELVARIRDEQKFASVEDLRVQLLQDQNKSLKLLV